MHVSIRIEADTISQKELYISQNSYITKTIYVYYKVMIDYKRYGVFMYHLYLFVHFGKGIKCVYENIT